MIPLFVMAGILCCCFTDRVQAEESVMPSCHAMAESQQSNDAAGTSSAEDCDCGHQVSLLAQKIIPINKLAASPFHNVKDILALNSLTGAHPDCRSEFFEAYQGPPQTAVNSLPIYLQISSLRL